VRGGGLLGGGAVRLVTKVALARALVVSVVIIVFDTLWGGNYYQTFCKCYWVTVGLMWPIWFGDEL
jgi:hypothetical protein